MNVPHITRQAFCLIACLIVSGAVSSDLAAQRRAPNPTAPRLFQPQERSISNRYTPRFMRTSSNASRQIISQTSQAQQANGGVVNGPVYDNPVGGTVVNGPVIGSPVGEVIVADGGYIDQPIDGGGGYSDCGTGDCGGCDNCGPLYDPRDCGINDDCWFGGLGKILCNAEYFAGVQSFSHQQFANRNGQELPNCSFGYHWGVNAGLPLYNLTCGLVSGQIGVNIVRSNLEDGVFSTGDRQQSFVTFGLYRRVDYGLQFGVVADILHEEFVSTLDMVQMRAELSWVWGNGTNFGFRFTENVQDDSGFVGGTFLPSINGQTIDTYRLFYRKALACGGYAETFYGRSDEQHNIFGIDMDLPISERVAFYAGFNYLSPDNPLPLTTNEAWNVQMGFTYRPRGRDWYKFYHRPLFKVADNGTMVQSRRP